MRKASRGETHARVYRLCEILGRPQLPIDFNRMLLYTDGNNAGNITGKVTNVVILH